MKYDVIDQSGKKVKDLQLAKEIFEISPNEHVIHQVVVAHLAARRSGNADTKERGEVRGGGRKPYRQKGTGRARQGTIRAPHYVGGGTVFGPTPRSYVKKVNKKVKDLAFKSALSTHVKNKSLIILDKIVLKEIKTKRVEQILKNINANGKTVILDQELTTELIKSSNNIPTLFVSKANHSTVYDLLNCKNLVLTEAAVKYFEEVLK